MSAVTSQRRIRGGEGTETVVQDLDYPAVDLLTKYLEQRIGTPTRVSLNCEVTNLLGYRWTCKPGFTIPKTREAVRRRLESGNLKAVVRPPLRLDEKRTLFAEQLILDKASGFRNCVGLMGSRKKRRKISPPSRSTNSTPPAPRIHTDSRRTDSDRGDDHGSGNHGPPLDTSGGSAVVGHAHLPRKRLEDEDADGIQIIGNDPFSEGLSEAYVSHDPTPISYGGSASRLTLPEFWDNRVKSVEVEAHNTKRKGSMVIFLTCTGTELKLKSFRSLLTSGGELESEIVDACLSMLACPMG
ncbi:MAG: hypothetical protein M1840_002159 [Geoglossum simile]|nr:MAG: hypothetical protein M1840_002159 [Geoglossum simile]